MKLFRSVLAVALSVGFIAEPGPAAVEQVSVRVDGLACPFCAYNIEKRVKTLEGVERDARIVTSIEHGIAKFPWKSGIAFDPAAVRTAIREAGFTPRELTVTVTGAIQVSSNRDAQTMLELVDEDAKLTVLVTPGERADQRESWDQMRALGLLQAAKLRVRVEGEVRADSADTPWSLILHKWAPLEYAAQVVAEIDDLACEQCSTRTMRALMELDGVIHVEADYETDRVHIWTRDEAPDLRVFRERIETLGFKVTHVHELDEVSVDGRDK
ncbi:MAG: cation transporter [Planctomycetes bacterium]|nr:cation transporter [Planctomycetota bacterium]